MVLDKCYCLDAIQIQIYENSASVSLAMYEVFHIYCVGQTSTGTGSLSVGS